MNKDDLGNFSVKPRPPPHQISDYRAISGTYLNAFHPERRVPLELSTSWTHH